jgi:hypothetical protein
MLLKLILQKCSNSGNAGLKTGCEKDEVAERLLVWSL